MIHVLYHANCYDGFGAAWAAWRKLGDDGVAYRAVSYGEVPPLLENRVQGKLYLLDFSFSRSTLLMLEEEFEIVVLDHHKTAQAELAGLSFATFDLEKSGAVLAWEHFHPGTDVPMMLQYVQDRDLWRFALPRSREAHAWMKSWPFDFSVWTGLATEFEDAGRWEEHRAIWQEGAAILRFQAQQVELMADQAVEITLGKDFLGAKRHRVHAVNATVDFSEVGEELCRRYPEEPFAAYWLDRADGRRQWGLRSRGGFDCSEVAKQYGGGGHPGAAGFTTQRNWLGD